MGSVFLDNVQGLETLKTFDADAYAAKKMNEQAEQFRVMTMNVLQIQLRSLTAMDIVAYGRGDLAVCERCRVASCRRAADSASFRGFLHSAAPIGVVLPCCDERHDFNQAYFRIA